MRETEMQKQYSSEVLALRDRVKKGNDKLNLAWVQLCQINHESQEWRDEFQRWHEANELLSVLCTQLKALGYLDCLFLDSNGKKMKKCGDIKPIGCRVCPSIREWWIEEVGFKS